MIKITTRQFETDQQIYSKLLHIPKGEVCVLISDSFSEKQIKENLEILFNKRSRNVESAIRSLKLEELAQFIAWKENKNQPLKEIDELFNEYAYTNRPKIFLNEFFKKEAVTEKDFIDAINKTIKNANEHFENENEILPEFKDLSVSNTNEINGAFEATFGYSSRFDYIDPATEEPKFIYRLQKGFVWLIQSEKALIIKASSPRINHIIRYQLENLLSANIVTLILDKELIDDLIGFNTLVSGNWIDTTNAKNKFRSITIKDKETYKKTEGKKINNDYDRRSSSRHTIKNSRLNKNTIVHIVENFGTISFSCQLKKSNLQEWATNLMKETKKRTPGKCGRSY